ncbi:MAG TPA: twin-arginine translocase TatA/TatE family subunit [Spirochaetes bacterium]|nr:twin-arginine translocase TatA/TatE family subunit [Spirochaetota bacterium]
MFGGIGMQEILIVLIIGLLVFGASRLPKIARSLGLGIKEFKKTIKGLDDDDDEPSKIQYVQQPPVNQQPNQPYNPGVQQQAYDPNQPYHQNQGAPMQPQNTQVNMGQPQAPVNAPVQNQAAPQNPAHNQGNAPNQDQAQGQENAPDAPNQDQENAPDAPNQDQAKA